MPTPIEILLDPISLMLFALYAGLMLWETLVPGRTLEKVPGWRFRGGLAFTAYFLMASYLPLFWDEALAGHQLANLAGLGVWGGAVAVVVYEGAVYFWHRTLHGSTILWRGLHQMHHSAERLDSAGAFYFSPLDIAGWTLLGSLCTVWILGMTPEAATLFLMATFFMGVFQHTNTKTPRWLGYIIQRPESHTVHHARGIHARNYSDLPIFDILFGTFENPAGFDYETGFHHGASARVLEMLCFQDVSASPEEQELTDAVLSTAV